MHQVLTVHVTVMTPRGESGSGRSPSEACMLAPTIQVYGSVAKGRRAGALCERA